MKMEVYEKKNAVTVVKPLENRLDASVALSFKEKLLELINEGKTNFVINLEDVNFIDSSGLGAIISGLRHIGVKGDIKLCCLAEQVESLLRLTRLDRVLGVFDSEEACLESF